MRPRTQAEAAKIRLISLWLTAVLTITVTAVAYLEYRWAVDAARHVLPRINL